MQDEVSLCFRQIFSSEHNGPPCGLKSGNSVRELISNKTKTTPKAQAGNKLSSILTKSLLMRKKPTKGINTYVMRERLTLQHM